MKLAPGTPLEIGLMLDESQPLNPVGRLAMADGLAQVEWTSTIIERQHRIDPLLYPAEPGLHAARGRSFEGLHGFLSDSLPDAWGRLLMKRRLEKLGIHIDTLSAVDRLALVGTTGRGALVYQPATMPTDDTGLIDLDALAEESRVLLLGDDAGQIDMLARLGGASGGARPKVHLGIASDGTMKTGS
jgi:serine/threonine-protein kinase HipA